MQSGLIEFDPNRTVYISFRAQTPNRAFFFMNILTRIHKKKPWDIKVIKSLESALHDRGETCDIVQAKELNARLLLIRGKETKRNKKKGG